jgi:AcrR family transcriptional regulator
MVATMPAPAATRARARADSRRGRERDIVAATRRLFDERGAQDAPIEEIAREVGLNKALIYRVFASKDELFVLTATSYLDELLDVELKLGEGDDPAERLREALDHFTRFCLRYPAFLDCALSLMRYPASELSALVSDGVWVRLGQAMAAGLERLSSILAVGAKTGAFAADDPDFAANRLYTQILGTMHLARLRVGVRRGASGLGEAFELDPERVRAACVDDAMAVARGAQR